MGILYDDVVIVKHPAKEGEPSVITVNCPDKTGLGCDLCRIILFFGLKIVRGDISTDGKWCYIVFWVVGSPSTRWDLVEKRLMGACPSCSSASGIAFYQTELQTPKPLSLFLLKLFCHDRRGLLHDVTEILSQLELTIEKVKVSTTPDGKVLDLFFVTDNREQLHTKERKDYTRDQLRNVLGLSMISCDIEMVRSEVTACSQGPSNLPPAITGDTLDLTLFNGCQNGSSFSKDVSVSMDNSLSHAHTLIQIVCVNHKGLLYDIMRTLKDYNIQISYGRFCTKRKTECEVDLFIQQSDGKKIVDPNKQNALASRIRMELFRPLRVALISRGPDTELVLGNPVELCGKGRPHVFHDITLALKLLNISIFSAEIGRHLIGDREWEAYRVRLDERDGLSASRNKVEAKVWEMLMGWEC